jgi:hypothetical protein
MFQSCAVLVSLLAGQAVHSDERQAGKLGPGDQGYRHEELHELYQGFFQGKCPCSIGECRPTMVRPNAAVPDTAMEVLIDGSWYPVPKDAVKLRENIPIQLLTYPAHVCARRYYLSGRLAPLIECVIYNGAI